MGKEGREQAKKDLEQKAWENHQKEYPECGGPLILREFIVHGYGSARSDVTTVLSNRTIMIRNTGNIGGGMH